jgi:hypothetical protein
MANAGTVSEIGYDLSILNLSKIIPPLEPVHLESVFT